MTEPTLQAMADELRLIGIERRDHIERLEQLGKRPPEELALKRARLETLRAAYRKFIELIGVKT